jgi:hypothetical protein
MGELWRFPETLIQIEFFKNCFFTIGRPLDVEAQVSTSLSGTALLESRSSVCCHALPSSSSS